MHTDNNKLKVYELWAKFTVHVFLLSFLSVSCSTDTDLHSQLESYPLEQTSYDQQESELSQLMVTDKNGYKTLPPGIYCAAISYEYGDSRVGKWLLKDGKLYGNRTDTIEVKLTNDGGNSSRIAAFIMNSREDIFLLPEDSLNKTIEGQSIMYTSPRYMLFDGKGTAYCQVVLNNQLFYTYNIVIFAKGGRCASSLKKKIPTVDETLATNLKHEALLPEARAQVGEEEKNILSSTYHSRDGERDRQNEWESMNLSPEDRKFYQKKDREEFDDYERNQIDLSESIDKARSEPTRLRTRSSKLENLETRTENSENDRKSKGILNSVIESLSGLFSKSEPLGNRSPVMYSIEVNSMADATDILISRGDKVTLNATGSVTLGMFAGSCGPYGIDGFEGYSKVQKFRHGSLIGKVGDGNWFEVGSLKSFVAQSDGKLHLQVNDNDPSNNSGSYTIECKIDK